MQPDDGRGTGGSAEAEGRSGVVVEPPVETAHALAVLQGQGAAVSVEERSDRQPDEITVDVHEQGHGQPFEHDGSDPTIAALRGSDIRRTA